MPLKSKIKNFMHAYENFCNWLAKILVRSWETYWSAKSNVLPRFADDLLKGTLLFVLCTVGTLYVSAWVSFGLPAWEHPVVVLGATLINLLTHVPAVITRVYSSVPAYTPYEEVLAIVLRNYFSVYADVACGLAILCIITVTYLVFIIRSALYYRHSEQYWNKWLAYATLFLLCLAVAAVLYFITIPFIKGGFQEGFALRIIKLCWHWVEKVISLHPVHQQARAKECKPNASGENHKSNNPTQNLMGLL